MRWLNQVGEGQLLTVNCIGSALISFLLSLATMRRIYSGVRIYIVCSLTYSLLFYSFPSIYDPRPSVIQ